MSVVVVGSDKVVSRRGTTINGRSGSRLQMHLNFEELQKDCSPEILSNLIQHVSRWPTNAVFKILEEVKERAIEQTRRRGRPSLSGRQENEGGVEEGETEGS